MIRAIVTSFFLFVTSVSHCATFTVTNTNNSGAGSLRQAILEANSVSLPESVFIFFDLPTSTPPPFPLPLFPVINPTAPLPFILRPVTIDGTTQGRFNRVGVQGGNAGAGADGLHLAPGSDGSVIRGLVINSWSGDGIELEQSDGTVVAGNWIGIDLIQGVFDHGNGGAGVHIKGSAGTRIGGTTSGDRNVISGNGGNGVWIIDGSTGTQVLGNYIGTDVSGSSAIPNTNNGVLVAACPGNHIGTPNGEGRNVISGNGTGITITGFNAVGNTIKGNYIGTDAGGSVDLGNLSDGIRIVDAQTTVVGGMPAAPVLYGRPPGNVISGNGQAGVRIQSGSGTVIQGNIIGGNSLADPGPPVDLGNGHDGIVVETAPLGLWPKNTILGGLFKAGNLVYGNDRSGIWIADGTGVVVQGNSIQRNQLHGLRIRTHKNLIGGPIREMGNVIAHNLQNGILIENNQGNLIGGATDQSGTFIYDNGGHGVLITGLNAVRNRIEGCNIGRDVQKILSPNAHYGVAIIDAANNIVGGTEAYKANTIVSNIDGGVLIQGPLSDGNRILGNGIGTTPDVILKGSSGNGHGISIISASNNLIGGTDRGSRNVVSGNNGNGILLQNGASNNLIQGNYIGVDANGVTAFGNGGAGIEILDSPNNTIGGMDQGARNVISSNEEGIFILGGEQSAGNVIQGNYIGTDASGSLPRGNSVNGVFGQVAGLVVGGTEPGARNVISANTASGIFLSGGSSFDCKVYGNFIGTDATGTAALGNGVSGVLLETAYQNRIGGTQPGAGNLISGNKRNGIWLVAFSQHNSIAGNKIGTNVFGNASLGNGENAVLIQDAQQNRIGPSNILSGTNQYGVWINHPLAKGNRIEGNFIGTDVTGTACLGNRFGGVLISDASDNYIGGSSPDAGNLISGNGGNGIRVFKMTNTPGRTLIQGNRIGTDLNGMAALGNMSRGIDFSAAVGCLIGGVTEGARNLISGNGFSGILFHDEASNCLIQGNFIGTDITGTLPLGNSLDGIFLENAPSNLVGGATTGAGNLISGNGTFGVHLLDSKATGNQIQGNLIGTDLSGGSGIGNASAGIYIKAATGNLLGGTGSGEGNTVAFNLAGVAIISGSMNPILSNSISSNVEIGIDLGDDGVTANDEIDSDTGPNDFQNYPVLEKATVSDVLTIEGTLRSGKETVYLLQFFASDDCDNSGHGEGNTLIGSATTTTDSDGISTFAENFEYSITGLVQITSTATDPAGNTSEFSECLAVQGLPTPTATATITPTPTPTESPVSPTPTQTPTPPEPPSEISNWSLSS